MNKSILFAFFALFAVETKASIHCTVSTTGNEGLHSFNQVIFKGEVEGRFIIVRSNFEIVDLSGIQFGAKLIDQSLGEYEDATVISAGYTENHDMYFVSIASMRDAIAVLTPPHQSRSDMAMTEKSASLLLMSSERNLGYVCKSQE